MEFAHPSLWVSDLEATRKFYEETIGLTVTREGESTVYYPGSENLFLEDDEGVEIQFKYDSEQESENPSGFDHIAFNVNDVDEAFNRITNNTNSPVVLEPATMEEAGLRIAFIKDPDGYKVELIEKLDSQ